MSFTTDVLVKIAQVKKTEALKSESALAKFHEAVALRSGTKLEQVKYLLDQCSQHWRVKDVYKLKDFETNQQLNQSDPGAPERTRTIENCQRDVARAVIDPAARDYLLIQVERTLLELIASEKHQFEHTQLFSSEISSAYEEDVRISKLTPASREEQQKQLEQWRELAQKPDDVDGAAVRSYLERVFEGTAKGANAIKKLRKKMRLVKPTDIKFSSCIGSTIKGLMRSDLLDDSRQETLLEYSKNSTILDELASVLQLRLRTLDQWDWTLPDSGALNAYQRRQLTGRYRVFFDYDLLDAIMWWAIGDMWCIELKSFLKSFQGSTWKVADWDKLDPLDARRRAFFIKSHASSRYTSISSVSGKIDQFYRNEIFMSCLPDSVNESGCGGYGSTEAAKNVRSPIKIKQKLLEMIVADAQVHSALEEPLAVLASDFAWFGPSISHTAVHEVLNYFGISAIWTPLIERFLKVQYRFSDCPTEVRKRGLPMSWNMSDFCSEALMFVLDYAYNQQTHTDLFRMNDDLWAWGTPQIVEKGWGVINEFSSVMGLSINEEKTGCVSTEALTGLPEGKVKYGYLCMNDRFQFTADLAVIEESMKEMRNQLSVYSTAFNRIKAWNNYLRFTLLKCLEPSRAFGIEHVNSVIQALLHRINPSIPNNLHYLLAGTGFEGKIEEIPRAVWYWPLNLGGFGVHDPTIELYRFREGLVTSSENIVADTMSSFEDMYEDEKKEYERFKCRKGYRHTDLEPEEVEWMEGSFMPLEEYKRYARYTGNSPALRMFEKLTATDVKRASEGNSTIVQALLSRSPFDTDKDIHNRFENMEPYWQNIVRTYARELVEKYGGIQLLWREIVPMGLASTFIKKKLRWNA